ncbi:MAG: hypothetical protein M1812_006472 [Candelaria pacifica]|nr:MAG: hypothetical protein M1812_006472 [Candelaria pacifica]
MTTRTAPLPGKAKPVGENGLKLEPGAWEPMSKVPDRYHMNRFYKNMDRCQGNSREDILEQMRNLAYNDFPTHSFSIRCLDAIDRLIDIEKTWVAGGTTSELETLFWQACYERNHDSLYFAAREKYLFAAADVEFKRKTDEVEERMRVAAEKAKEATRKKELAREEALIASMNEAELGLSFANEIEQALMDDPDCYVPSETPTPVAPKSIFRTPMPPPKLTADGFRRPGASARVKKLTVTDYIRDHTDGNDNRKHEVETRYEPGAKRSRMDRTSLRDKTNAPSPFLKDDDIHDPFVRHLLNRPANLPKNNNPKRFSVDGTRLDRPMSRATQRMTGLAASRQAQAKPLLQGIQELHVAEPMLVTQVEEEESEEEL